mmetsp:Transcript_28888/g.52816  ORF Transcript_28888/g.52816 Transcript_28888/m.52816 type:complete len:730 (-) Transcript_28888:193-2382(-)
MVLHRHGITSVRTGSKAKNHTVAIADDLVDFKGFARKLALSSSTENHGSLLVEWASSVADLHRVLDVTRSLYLLNQSHNEILLRVGIELATSETAKGIFQWTDGDWYGDDSRREWFRDVVQAHTTHVLEMCSGERKDDKKLAAANLKMREAQAELSVAMQKCEAAEATVEETRCKVRNLERALEGKSNEFLETQQQLDHAQVQLKAAREKVSISETKLRDSRKAVASVEAQLRDADARCLGLEEDLAKQKAELECLRVDVRSRDLEIGRMQAENASLLSKNERVAEPNASMKPSTPAQVSERKTNQERLLRQKSAELKNWVTAAQAAEAQVTELRGVVDHLQEKLTVFEQAGDNSSTFAADQVGELEKALVDIKATVTSLDAENDALRGQLEAALAPPPRAVTPESKAADLPLIREEAPVPPKTPPPAPKLAPMLAPSTDEMGLQAVKDTKSVEVPTSQHPKPVCSNVTEAPVLKSTLEDSRRSLRRLELENQQLKTALEGLHRKLKSAVGSCPESGVVSQLSEVISMVDAHQMKFSKNVWERLYGDAMHRYERIDRTEELPLLTRKSAGAEEAAADEQEQKVFAKGLATLSANLSANLNAHNQMVIEQPDTLPFRKLHGNPTDVLLGTKLFHATGMGGQSQKSLSLPPCTVARRVPKCASAYHLRSGRRSRGKQATTSSNFHIGSEDVRSCSVSPQKGRPSTSISLPSLHGYRLQTSQSERNILLGSQ